MKKKLNNPYLIVLGVVLDLAYAKLSHMTLANAIFLTASLVTGFYIGKHFEKKK